MIGSLLPSIVAAVLRPPTLSRSRLLVAQQQGYTQGQPAGWTTSFDFDGTPYFCSDQTGECQWEPPQWAQQGQSAQVTWSVRGVAGVSGFTHPDGFTHLDRYRDLPYFVQSGEELVLSRWNMEVQKLHVSREQCTVSVLGDGTASQRHDLEDGDMVSLDAQDPDAAVLMCVAEGASQPGSALPAGWFADVDPASGDTYFFNEQTGETQWEFPRW
ncbi:hypothetical protein EMIHUDRAFT_225675 [Emiliania huxleyi CCMP1516]|nr:hypothetical protein EMIHUDRAFT_225675 [Emiliania huxleyi CCMP1516]EOD37248.1 hypothetical protein EMIHUDRAFT_225675 [Emiliania huxleyi CCMP1516]|eukprot:XP_005789677.1 hypothetical protein EMIHUDRAFT_225675 [Emiliania huxleyi CCMP1516]